ncbi:hypothetical protein ANO11243_004560 [Dothideomycetidae sp. 11243]|nr:hypothetical protein ANO11243_004560 [fungal sp. No.11243]
MAITHITSDSNDTASEPLTSDPMAQDAQVHILHTAGPSIDVSNTQARQSSHEVVQSSEGESAEDSSHQGPIILPKTQGVLRTVCITNLPRHSTVYEIIQQLKFGMITEVMPSSLRFMKRTPTILVTFLDQDSALKCISTSIQRIETLKTLEGHSCTFTISPEPLAAAPMTPDLYHLVENGAVSRILQVTNLTPTITHKHLARALAVEGTLWHGILAIKTLHHDSHGRSTIALHISSIKNALRCYKKSFTLPELRNCTITFQHDTCLPSTTPPNPVRAQASLAQYLADENAAQHRDGRRAYAGSRTARSAAPRAESFRRGGRPPPATAAGIPRAPRVVFEFPNLARLKTTYSPRTFERDEGAREAVLGAEDDGREVEVELEEGGKSTTESMVLVEGLEEFTLSPDVDSSDGSSADATVDLGREVMNLMDAE